MNESRHVHSRTNMLLVGPDARIDALITAFTGRPASALATWQPGVPSETDPVPDTVLVRNVHLLDGAQQAQLHETIARWHGRARVVATAPAPVYPLVRRGVFLESLYYRLNMLCLEPPQVAGPHREHEPDQ